MATLRDGAAVGPRADGRADASTTADEPPASNDEAAIRKLAADADSCPFDSIRGFTAECDALDRWEAESDLFADGRNDGALVWLLERGSERSRTLASSKIAAEGSIFRDDAGLASRIMGVAEKEMSEAVGASLGHAVASLDLRTSGAEKRILALLERRANRTLVMGVLEELTTHNDPTPALDATLAHAATDPRPGVRQAAVLGLSASDDVVACKAWKQSLLDSDPSVALAAAHAIVTRERCPGLIDPVLAFIGKGQRGGLFGDAVAAVTLVELCESDTLDAPQRGLAASLAEGFAAPDLPLGLREEALRAALACSTDERRFVKRFTTDSDEWVRRRAKDLLKEGHGAGHHPKKSH